MSEEEELAARIDEMEAWALAWFDYDVDGKRPRGKMRAGLLRSKKNILEFCREEAYQLPSRVLYRRMVQLDEMVVRRIFNSMPKADRDILTAEVSASAKAAGETYWGEKSRLIHNMYGIPRF